MRMPPLKYPWPREALASGAPWIWPSEVADDLNRLEPFIAARVKAELLTALGIVEMHDKAEAIERLKKLIEKETAN